MRPSFLVGVISKIYKVVASFLDDTPREHQYNYFTQGYRRFVSDFLFHNPIQLFPLLPLYSFQHTRALEPSPRSGVQVVQVVPRKRVQGSTRPG
jgi:hypothetical protein